MIDFACNRCRNVLSVPADLAGGDVQCPDCGLLNAVPLPSDLENVNPDGTLRLRPLMEREEPDRLGTLARLYGSRRVDDDGDDIDNRLLAETVDLAPIPEPARRVAPQYDPDTGELVAPLAVVRNPVPAIPIDQPVGNGPPALSYVTPGKTEMPVAGGVWLRMFEPANAAVLVVVAVAHLLAGIVYPFVLLFLAVLEAQGMPHIPAWLFNLVLWLVAAHYGNVVQDTGPEEKEQLSRPLRHGAFVDDLVAPLFRVLVAFCLAYLPAVALLNSAEGEAARILAAAALVLGGLAFPALLLTMAAGATLSNLRPDRLARVVATGGVRYWLLAALSTLIVPLYLRTLAGADLFAPLFEDGGKAQEWFQRLSRATLLMVPLALVCIYAMHGICWRLGQMFREHGAAYGWAWEEHEEQRRENRRKRQEALQRAAMDRTRGRRKAEAAAAAAKPAAPKPQFMMESLQSREHM